MEAYQRLEHEYAEFCNNQNTVACSSGTAALHLALETLKVTEGWNTAERNPTLGSIPTERMDGPIKVVVPDFAMIACARAVMLAGMTPKFTDVNKLGLIEYYVEEPSFNLRIVMPVHTYGRKCNTDYETHQSSISLDNLTPGGVIEDLAEAHGIQPNPKSLAACWSFYKNKIIHGEEGGMVAFATEEQQTLAKKLRNMGSEDNQNFQHIPRGMNYRMSNVHAQLVLESLHKFKDNRLRRLDIEGWYDHYCPEKWRLPPRDIPWVYDLDLPQNVSMERVVKTMNTMGVQARCGFKPLSQQKEYQASRDGFKLVENVTAYQLSKTRMYLPIHTWATKLLVRRTMELLKEAIDVCEKSPI